MKSEPQRDFIAMSPKTSPTEAEIWERIIRPQGPMTKSAARRIAKIEFGESDIARMRELAEKNRRGALSDEEADELDHFCRVGTVLSILKLRSVEVLKSSAGRT
jgi:hypothetical protein